MASVRTTLPILKEVNTLRQTFGLLGFALILSTFYCVFRYLSKPTLNGIPRAGKSPGWFGLSLAEAKRDFVANGPTILREGYAKYKDSMFLIQTADMERVVLNPRFIEEINKTVPEGTLSMIEGLRDRLLSSQTNLDIIFRSPLHNDVCKVQLTRNLHRIIPTLNEEASYWLAQQIPHKVELNGYDTILRAIVGTASRVFVGLPVCRDPEWLQTAVAYSFDVFSVAVTLRKYPSFLRPLIAPWIEGTKVLDHHLAVARKCFIPLFVERLTANQQQSRLAEGHAGAKGTVEEKDDMIQWMAESARGTDRDPAVLAHNMLFMTVAAVHTSAASAIHVLYDLCAMPEYWEPLREEAERVVSAQGWTMLAIHQLKKLDSFMKESQRLNHPGLLTFNRKVVRPLHLSDGTTLPTGTFITMPSDAVARDPDLYTEPDRFDGFRFYDKRASSSAEANRHQFTTTGPDSLPFGHGKLACPGRFFAGAQIKIILANIMLNYDVSFPSGQAERPKNLFQGELVGPDRKQALVFRPRNPVGEEKD